MGMGLAGDGGIGLAATYQFTEPFGEAGLAGLHPNGDWAFRAEFNLNGLLKDEVGGSDLVNTGSFVTSFEDSIRGYVAQYPASDTPQLNGAYTGNSTGDASWAMWFKGVIPTTQQLMGSATINDQITLTSNVQSISVGGDGTFWLVSPNLLSTEWYYLTVTRISNVFRLYIDDGEETNIVAGTGISTNAFTLDRIGAINVGLHWAGEIDNVTSWDRGLTTTQVKANYEFEKR